MYVDRMFDMLPQINIQTKISANMTVVFASIATLLSQFALFVMPGNLDYCAKGLATQAMVWKRKLNVQVCDTILLS